MDERKRVHRITKMIDKKIRDYPILTILMQFVGEWYLDSGYWPTIPNWTFEAKGLPLTRMKEDSSYESPISESEEPSRGPPQPQRLDLKRSTEREDDIYHDEKRSRSYMTP